jgi:peptide/nickel transport system substrate-binding protein
MKKLSLSLMSTMLIILLTLPALCLAGPKAGGSLTYGTEADLRSVDPHKTFTNIEASVMRTMTESLIAANSSLEPIPTLAESWKASADSKEYTFYLKKGVKFHNGREFTANDVLYNFKRVMDEKTAATHRSSFTGVDVVQVIDRYTVKFVLKQPSGSFLSKLYNPRDSSFAIIARESVNQDGKVTHPIGTGPFEFVEWKQNEYLKLKKFKNYRVKGLPYLDELKVIPVPDISTRFNALSAGDLDVARILPNGDVIKLMKNPSKDVKVFLQQGALTWNLHFNVSKAPFNDVRVRQAIAYAINREDLNEGVTQGLGAATNQWFPPGHPWHFNVPKISQNIQKAKSLLKQAGYPNGFDVICTTSSAYPTMVDAATIVQAQLLDVGINVKLDVSDWPTTMKKLSTTKFAFGSTGWPVPVDPDVFYPRALLPKGSSEFNTGFAYNNPDVTRLIKAGGNTADTGKRKDIYQELTSILVQDAPWIWMFSTSTSYGWRSYVKGYKPVSSNLAWGDGGLQYVWIDK